MKYAIEDTNYLGCRNSLYKQPWALRESRFWTYKEANAFAANLNKVEGRARFEAIELR